MKCFRPTTWLLLSAAVTFSPVDSPGAARATRTPADASPQAGPPLRSATFPLSEADRAYWAFHPVVRPALPVLRPHPARLTNPLDVFVLARLDGKRLAMNPPATPRELVRRASFDLLG